MIVASAYQSTHPFYHIIYAILLHIHRSLSNEVATLAQLSRMMTVRLADYLQSYDDDKKDLLNEKPYSNE